MTDPQNAALQALLTRVEAGDSRLAILDAAGKWAHAYGNVGLYLYVTDAHFGSLDAAKALHEAVLPGRSCGITFGGEYGATVTFPSTWDDMHLSVSNTIPARAWLIAILRALIATPQTRRGGDGVATD